MLIRRTAMLIFVLMTVLAVGSSDVVVAQAATSAPAVPVFDLAAAQPVSVTEIVDGDTIKVSSGWDELTIRLIGVDTPETVHPTTPVQEFGKEASAFTRNLLLGEDVYLFTDAQTTETDRYGRTLAYVCRAPDGLFVNLEIVRQGYGHAYTRFPFDYMELFKTYEQRASEIGKGLWADDETTVETIPAPTVSSTPSSPPSTYSPAPQQDADSSITVYITRTGSKYHRGTCRYLSKSKIPISLADAKASGYGP